MSEKKFYIVRDQRGVRYYFNRFNEAGESYWWHSMSWDSAKPRPRAEAKAILKQLRETSPDNTYLLEPAQ